MITIYHLSNSQSDRIVWLMEELGLPYKLEWFDRGPDMFAPPEYKALHPVATAPTIRDGDTVICDSAAVIYYILYRHAGGRLAVPVDSPHFADFLYWMSFTPSVQGTIAQKLAANPDDTDPTRRMYYRSACERLEVYYRHLEMRLGEVPYLAGPEFTAADVHIMFTLTTMTRWGGPAIDHLKNVVDYVKRVTQRPAYIKAMAMVGPDAKRPI